MLARKFGGAERLFVDFCIALAESGEDVQAICLAGSDSASLLKDHDSIKLATIKVLGSWDMFASGKIAALLKEHGSQVVQAHLARGALLAGRACAQLGLPLVVTTHNYIDPKYYRHVSMLVPPTRAQADYYLGKGIPEERISLIRHFSPLEKAVNVRRGTDKHLRFVAVGRLVHKKGFHVLLESFARLAEKQGERISLDIGGAGPEEASLKQMIARLGLQDRVRLVGWIDDVAAFLQTGDVFVLPSLDEPFGIVVIEAMASGVAIVSTTSQGPSETLDQDTAWLSEVNDVESLAQAMQQASGSAEQRHQKALKAQEVFGARYSKEAIIPQFMKLYASL